MIEFYSIIFLSTIGRAKAIVNIRGISITIEEKPLAFGKKGKKLL